MTRNTPKLIDPVKESFARGVYGYIARLPRDRHVTGEDIRVGCIQLGIIPASPNAWGGIILSAANRGLIAETGVYVPMSQTRSHKRRTAVFRVIT